MNAPGKEIVIVTFASPRDIGQRHAPEVGKIVRLIPNGEMCKAAPILGLLIGILGRIAWTGFPISREEIPHRKVADIPEIPAPGRGHRLMVKGPPTGVGRQVAMFPEGQGHGPRDMMIQVLPRPVPHEEKEKEKGNEAHRDLRRESTRFGPWRGVTPLSRKWNRTLRKNEKARPLRGMGRRLS